MNANDRAIARIQRYRLALETIARLPKGFDGRTDEEVFDDTEDAYCNGLEVGRYEALKEAAAIARGALK